MKFENFDFSILNDPDFKEDSVREEIILPIIKNLGYQIYGNNRIIRSKNLEHPFVKVGTKKRKIKIIPDYLFEVSGKYAWVLDAKNPSENIISGDNLEQAYFYAIHPDIRVDYYALCNGKEFVLRKIDNEKAVIYFRVDEIESYWEQFKSILSPDAFIEKSINQDIKAKKITTKFDYSKCPLLPTLPVRKRAAKRHFGVHGYFTKQSWNVVQKYISNFTKPDDVVLDPFGGSGITAIESLMIGRKGINIDINPMSIFIIKSLTTPTDLNKLSDEFENIEKKFNKNKPEKTEEIENALKKFNYPQNVPLMKNADVDSIEKLFSKLQLAQLAYLKSLIIKVKDDSIKNTLLLVFSTSLTKLNLTYHNSKAASPNAGDCAAFRFYRYRMAKEPVRLDVWKTFNGKFKNIVRAKKEIAPIINNNTIKDLIVRKGTATNIDFINDESIDYIYTDPPYGNKIPYLDLSVMWNSWLDLEVTEEDYQLEAIEGGELDKTSDEYFDLLYQSMKEMYRVLKFDRWISFVFAHKNPKYWHFIIETAQKLGFEYAGSVQQPNGQTSYKKRTMSYSVLAGQLIINFRKVKTPQAIQKINLGIEIYDLIIETIESAIAENDGATLEQINDSLIIRGLELGFLDILSKKYKDLTPILLDNFDYDEDNKIFHIKENKKFKANIPLDLRIRYFLISFLKRRENENTFSTTDEIILGIMPLLKNGITPKHQTILKVLEKIAVHIGNDRWQLSRSEQLIWSDL